MAWIAIALALALVVPGAWAQATDPPETIRYGPFDYFLDRANTLDLNNTAASSVACVGLSSSNSALPATMTFAIDLHTVEIHGSSYPLGRTVTVALAMGPVAPAPGGLFQDGSGYDVAATFQWGDGATDSRPAAASVGDGNPSTTATQTLDLSFDITGEVNASALGQLSLRVAFAAKAPQGAGPGAVEVAVQCGSPDAKISQLALGRGMVGDGDIDGDSVADSEDEDRDGDGVSNTIEGSRTCSIGGTNVTFADDPRIVVGADSDGDGYLDEVECAAGADPLDAGVIPPQPAGVPWVLIIVLVLILAIVGGLVFVVMTYGRVINLEIVSVPQMIIAPGSVGKYEISLSNRKKSGEPLTVQVATEGLPEGWDAKTDVDHVSLEPDGGEGSSRTVTLTIEAPEHGDAESAVVALKAIPLNKAGRKDTLRLAGKAETITSINVPPDAKVPVRRGDPIKLKSPDEQEAESSAPPLPPEGLPVDELPDITAAQSKKLQAQGLATTEPLRTADPDAVAGSTKISAEKVRHWQRVADLIRVQGITPEMAHALIAAGISSVEELASKEPEEVAELFNAQVPADEPEVADLELEVS